MREGIEQPLLHHHFRLLFDLTEVENVDGHVDGDVSLFPRISIGSGPHIVDFSYLETSPNHTILDNSLLDLAMPVDICALLAAKQRRHVLDERGRVAFAELFRVFVFSISEYCEAE
ncbi:hypothetical protein BLNAU_2507 [Blattamonas nauphoetae]|nr:hypothetical protein BLNAU_5202 [Blattamonas nauphoetae]KAK2962674.1 hypothetical protein BLNAU_2507 [Blattamonas nauphoetae]